MLRNLPNNYSRSMLLAMLEKEGFSGQFDFVYLPIDFQSKACLGYAFINLLNPSLVPHFWKTFCGYSKWILPSKKICSVSWSGPHQGFQAHIERYQNSPVMHASVPDEYKPVIFRNGVRVPFPEPTKVSRPPRSRQHSEFKAHWSTIAVQQPQEHQFQEMNGLSHPAMHFPQPCWPQPLAVGVLHRSEGA